MTRVILQVGEHVYHTTQSTLQGHKGFLAALFRYETQAKEFDESTRPVDESIESPLKLFIDRDGTHFRHILNYLRGSPSFPTSHQELVELRAEADFYLLEGLLALIDHQKRVIADTTSVVRQLEIIASKLH